jgi:hypothetical protein
LQKLPGASVSDPFLYDDSFLGENVSRSTVRAHGDAIVLKPGVAAALARLAGLLKPALEIMWVEDVRRMNKFLDTDVPDVAGHLFGRERTGWLRSERRSRMHSDRTASTAERICRRTIPSTMCCRGLWWGSTVWRIWCWRADAATATRAMHCPQCLSSIAPLPTRGCLPWRTSQQNCSGRRSANAWLQRPAASTGASRRGSRPGRGIDAASGSTSASRRGGSSHSTLKGSSRHAVWRIST